MKDVLYLKERIKSRKPSPVVQVYLAHANINFGPHKMGLNLHYCIVSHFRLRALSNVNRTLSIKFVFTVAERNINALMGMLFIYNVP